MFKIQKIASRFHERFPGCAENYPLHPNRKAPELGLSFGRWKHYAVYQDMPFGTQISHWDSLGTSPTTGWYLYPFKSQFILISSQRKLLERDPFNFIHTWSIIRTWDSMDRSTPLQPLVANTRKAVEHMQGICYPEAVARCSCWATDRSCFAVPWQPLRHPTAWDGDATCGHRDPVGGPWRTNGISPIWPPERLRHQKDGKLITRNPFKTKLDMCRKSGSIFFRLWGLHVGAIATEHRWSQMYTLW